MEGKSANLLRNVAIIGHGGAGKTSLVEAMLYDSGEIDRLGRTDDGTTTSDYEPEEIKRKISISTSIAHLTWKEHAVNLIDTPGYTDFMGEVYSALRVADGAVLVINAVSGVEVGTERTFSICTKNGLPLIFVINRMDRESASFYKSLENIKDSFGDSVVPLALPLGQEANFRGVVDLLQMKGYLYVEKGSPGFQETDIPPEMDSEVNAYRNQLVERIVETEDELLMKYLEGEEISQEEMTGALRSAIISRKLTPVLPASAVKNIGVELILDYIASCLPSPVDREEIQGVHPITKEVLSLKPGSDSPFTALVFKTTADPYVGKLSLFRVYSGQVASDTAVYNPNKEKLEKLGQLYFLRGKNQTPVPSAATGDIVAVAKLTETSTRDTLCDKDSSIILPKVEYPATVISMAVEPKAKGDEEKISSGLSRLAEEDPTFQIHQNLQTRQLVISGMGEQHLAVMVERLKRKFGTEVVLTTPRIPYKETIKKTAKAEYKYKKQTGGRGQYGHVFLELKPRGRGEGFEFLDTIFGGAIPRSFVPAVEKGVREVLEEGVIAGYPVVDISANVYDGSYHTVDSSEMAFKIASSMAFKKGFLEAEPVLLEPIMNVQVASPEEYMGDIIGDLNSKRGKILGIDRGEDNLQTIKAQVPLAEMHRYYIDLTSITHGRGSFNMEFSHYEEVPAFIAEKIIQESAKESSKEKE
ncbi:elongation factor G [Candidatus Hakubella thermalkaliphila]|uniref:Elongation factor G n=3 Tax=Candidatus Hakubella thermalkaliphila TaxID=2754717 RepID=A0A6V8PRA1_9ACTN|nr:elongation factor G [Candidatus Hakubella thermalkaliphila]GFP34304.1 elongation factor G [Candidatus Hakubella thermalkaliphila]